MFNFLRKKQTNAAVAESDNDVSEISMCEAETGVIEQITPTQLSEFIDKGQLIEIKNTVSAGISKIVEHLPETIARKDIGELYRLDMNGVKGVLMSHGTGSTTTIIDETTKRFKATATINQVGTAPVQVLANIMNVASVAAGMYYMSEITNQLQHTERLLGGVKQFLEDEKRAEIIAIYGELKKVYDDYQFCITDNGYNESLLMTNRNVLANIEQKLDADIEFYILQLSHSYDKFKGKDKTKAVDETIQDVCVDIVLLKQLFELFCVKTVLEINYSDKKTSLNERFIKSRKELLLSKHSKINNELEKMSEVEEYLFNERYSLFDGFKAMQLDDAFKEAVQDVSAWKLPIKYRFSAKVIVNAIKNYEGKRKNNVEMKLAEINDNIGGFNIDTPTKYTDMIDNLSMLNTGCPNLIINGEKVYVLRNI